LFKGTPRAVPDNGGWSPSEGEEEEEEVTLAPGAIGKEVIVQPAPSTVQARAAPASTACATTVGESAPLGGTFDAGGVLAPKASKKCKRHVATQW
jgi:hypothetical protein